MKFRIVFTFSCLLILTACPSSNPQPPAGNSESAPAESVAAESATASPFAPAMQEVAETLDAGGPVFSIKDGDYEWEAIKPIYEFFHSIMTVAAGEEDMGITSEQMDTLFDQAPSFLGLSEIQTRGMSTVQLADGSYRTKYVLQQKADADGVLWKMSGNSFDIDQVINRHPSHTVLLTAFSLDAPFLRDTFRNVLIQHVPGSVSTLMEVDTEIQMSGFPLEDALKGLKDGFSFALTMNPDTRWPMPVPGPEPVSIPETGLVVSIGDAQGSLTHFVVNVLGEQLPPAFQFIEKEQQGVTVHRISNLPLPVPVNFQIARINDRMVFTTSDASMAELIERKGGEKPSPLLSAKGDVPSSDATQLWIYSPVLAEEVKIMTEKGMSMARQMGEPEMVEIGKTYMGLFYSNLPTYVSSGSVGDLYVTTMHHQHPILGGDQSGTSLTIAPAVTGMLAAIALPAFQKARESAQQNACINNLRMIEGAKDQVAIENNLTTGTLLSEEQIAPYLRGGVPVCPAGGNITINPIAQAPVCSIHGSVGY